MTEHENISLTADADYLSRISLHADQFSPIERKISDYLLSNQGKNIETSINAFAEEVGVSVSSVIRYCKLLGYSGFSELKFCVQQENFSLASNDLSIHLEDDIGAIKRKTAQFAHTRIEKTMQQVDDNELRRAVAAIKEAKNVYFCGVGSASGVAQLAANQFMVLGIRAFAQSDFLLNLRSASYLGVDEVIVVINYDGYSTMSSNAIMLAKEAGATTILITSATDTLAQSYADIVLRSAARNDINTLNIVTVTMCQLAVIQTLMVGVWQEDRERFTQSIQYQKSIAEMTRYDKQQKAVVKGRVISKP